MEEIWKDIKDAEGKYFVSNLGNVKSKYKHLTQFVNGLYNRVTIHYSSGVQKTCYVHRLVAEAFLPNPDDLPQVNHKDGNKRNNSVDNLEWCTELYNQQHKIKVLHKDSSGTNNPMYGKKGPESPVFKDYILQIDKDGNVVGRFETALAAAISINGVTKNNTGASRISAIASHKNYGGHYAKTYKGFKWLYEKEYIGGFKTL